LAKAKGEISLGISALLVIALILLVGFGTYLANNLYGSRTTAYSTASISAVGSPPVIPSSSFTQSGNFVECQRAYFVVWHVMETNSTTHFATQITSSSITSYSMTTNVSQINGYSIVTTIYPTTTEIGAYESTVQACTWSSNSSSSG